jgi:ABC-type spermidine/putrescine transport system permease subunit II
MNRHRQSLLEASKMLQVVVVEVSLQWYQAVWTAPEWKDQFHSAHYQAPTLLRALQR